jgi:hypothetical protein
MMEDGLVSFLVLIILTGIPVVILIWYVWSDLQELRRTTLLSARQKRYLKNEIWISCIGAVAIIAVLAAYFIKHVV